MKNIVSDLSKKTITPTPLKKNKEIIPLYISSSDHTSLSLEYFINQLDEDKEIQKQELYEKLYSMVFDTQECEEESIKLEYGEIFLGFIQTFIDTFPFSFVLQDSQSLALKLLNALLNSTYAKEMIKAFDATLRIKDLCLSASKDQIRFYQVLSSRAQEYESISLDREFNKQEALTKALDEVAKEIPNAFIGAITPENILDLRAFANDFFYSLLGTFTHSIFISLAQSINTEFEKQKKAFEMLLYTKFTDKNNAPLALKREEGVYYPIGINQTFLSFSFQNMILGGEFCTGGLGYLKSNFYLLQESTSGQPKNKNTQENPSIVRNYQLNILFSLLCLDEIRNREAGEREEDQKFFRQNHSEKEFINYILDLENEQDLALYESYGEGSGEVGGNGQAEAIDSYQVAMQYLGDIQKGAFDSDTNSNKPNPKKHRGAIRALDNIGKNNIRGLYVGIKKKEIDKTQQEKRPKLIGRLATTIIMKDGLWIG